MPPDVAETQKQTADTIITTLPKEEQKQPLGSSEAAMAQMIDSLGDGHAADPDRSLKAILNFPLFGKVKEAVGKFRTKKVESAPVNEAEINKLEQEVGIHSEEDRLIEASLLVDKKFIDTAVITNNTQGVERMFGDKEWADWIEARVTARDHSGELTPDFIQQLHTKLLKRSDPQNAGVLRNERIVGGDYSKLGTETVFTTEQLAALTDNPYLATVYQGKDPNTRLILYPNADIEQAHLFGKSYPLSEKAKTTYEQGGKTTESLVAGMLADVSDWYNNEVAKPDHDPYALAAELQRKVVSIHPGNDASGRLSRVLMNWSLEKDGLAPAIVDEPSDDILVNLEQWTEKIREGSDRYTEIQSKKQEMEQAEIKDMAELMGLDEERTFNDYIYTYIRKPPLIEPGKPINHKAVDQYLATMRTELQQFKQEFSADTSTYAEKNLRYFGNSIIQKHFIAENRFKSEQVKVHQGGLISRLYIDLTKKMNRHSKDYIQKHFFQSAEAFRGGVTQDTIDDQVICTMFEKFVGLGTGYRPLIETQINPNSSRTVVPEAIVHSLEDYNKVAAQSYLIKHHPTSVLESATRSALAAELKLGKNPLSTLRDFMRGKYFADLAHNHKFGHDIARSPFASTSLSSLTAHVYSHSVVDRYTPDRYGVVFKTRVPKTGAVLGFRTDHEKLATEEDSPVKRPNNYEVDSSEIPAITKPVMGNSFSEVYMPGGVDPRAVEAILVTYYPQKESNEPANKNNLAYVAERVTEDGQEMIVVRDYRKSEDGVDGEVRKYSFNEDSGKYEPLPPEKDYRPKSGN